MYQLFRNTAIVFLFFLATGNIEAVPAYPFPIQVIQPDGSTLTLLIRGDESSKLRTTIDGYPVRQNSNGYYTYAEALNPIATGRIAKDPELRSSEEREYLARLPKLSKINTQPGMSRMKQASFARSSSGFPASGSPRSLVILVNFTDKSFVVPDPATAFHRLLNEENYTDNGGTGSAADYFRASSNGQFAPIFDVIGPYNLPNTLDFYGANDEDDYDVRPTNMVIDACNLANADVNFADYDADGDGYVDNIFIYYAGYNEAEGGPENTIWPHRWVVYSGNYSGSTTFDGKTIFDYACTSELKGATGTQQCGIGTFTHEFGHVIGMPDYYHTDEPDKATLETWSIMDYGAYLNEGRTPPVYSAYDRFYLGWLTPEELAQPADKALYPLSQAKTPLATSAGQAYLLSATTHNLNGAVPAPGEFFILEYRKKTGWDAYLPAEGLLIWHIDYNQSAWDQNGPNNYTETTQTAASHMRVYLQPLSGNSATPGTAFTSGSFTPISWAGTSINRPITGISKTPEEITFSVMGGAAETSPKMEVGVITNLLVFPPTKVGQEQIKHLNFRSDALSGTIDVELTGVDATQFQLSATSLSTAESGTTGGTELLITYKPVLAGQHTAILTVKTNNVLPDRIIVLQGEAVE
jgi:M6 family metalloprotease-like protein